MKFKNGKTSKCFKTQNKCKNNVHSVQLQLAGQTNQTIQTNIQELSALNGIDFNDIGRIMLETTEQLLLTTYVFTGAQHLESGPSHGVPDQNNPEKYLNHNHQHLIFIIDNTLYYRDVPN